MVFAIRGRRIPFTIFLSIFSKISGHGIDAEKGRIFMNYINWFEIPVKDITRGVKFYSDVLVVKLEVTSFGGTKMAIFPSNEQGGVHGALVEGDGYEPCEKGSLLYLNGGEDLSKPLGRVKSAGGLILQDKMNIGPHGFIAIFRDSEGNRVALHSRN